MERDRLMQFFNAWIHWYQLNDENIPSILQNFGIHSEDEIIENEDVAKQLRRSLESYLHSVQPHYSTRTSNFNSIQETALTPRSHASLASASSTSNTFPQTKSGKHVFDFSAVSADAVDQIKRNQIVSKISNSPHASLTTSRGPDRLIQLQDIVPYHYHPDIPKVLQILVLQLKELDVYSEKGIFRISSDSDQLSELMSDIYCGFYYSILEVTSGYLISSLSHWEESVVDAIKSFLRAMKPSLISIDMAKQLYRIGKQNTDESVDEAWKVIESLPRPNYMTLVYIFTLIHQVALVESNQMSANSLVSMCVPNILESVLIVCVISRSRGEEDDLWYATSIKVLIDFFEVIVAFLTDHFDIQYFKDDFPYI